MAENKNEGNLYCPINTSPWKVWLSPTVETSSSELVNLFDLLFYEQTVVTDNEEPTVEIIERANPGDNQKVVGLPLKKDIFLWNTSKLYKPNGEFNLETDQEEFLKLWSTSGYDITPPQYDSRSKPYEIKIESSTKNTVLNRFVKIFNSGKDDGWESSGAGEVTFEVYNPEAAVEFSDVYSFWLGNTKLGNADSQSWNWRKDSLEMATVSNQGIRVSDITNNTTFPDIILSDKDSVFETSIKFESNIFPYTKLCLSTKGSKVSAILFQAFYNLCSVKKSMSEENFKMYSGLSSDMKDKTLFTPDNIKELVKDNSFVNLLKHLYVFIRVPAVANYVKPKDFDQDLNPTSNVIHSNIYASNEGNFKRFNEVRGIESSSKKVESKDSYSYIPKNSPLKDYVSEKYLKRYGVENVEVENAINTLYEKTADPLSRELGSVLVEPISNDDNKANLSPTTYFDPESRRPTEDYSRVPTLISKKGNIIADERIISPTIDEIWYIIKKIISGRDDDNSLDSSFSRAKGDGKTKNDKDTRLTEVTNTYTFKYTGKDDQTNDRIGDPVDFEYTKDNEGFTDSVKVTEFFSQPDVVNYAIFEDLSNDENTLLPENFLNENYTSLKNVKVADIDKEGPDTRIEVSKKGSSWAPRKYPLTLRELEARSLGNKYAIVKNFRYLTTNFGVVGGLGHTGSEEDSLKNSAGSLYQFHKDYNFKHESPNTIFKKKLKSTVSDDDKNSTDIVYQDFSKIDSDEQDREKNAKKVDESEGMISFVKNYGASVSNYQKDYNASQVYMGADGQWHYIAEHVRIPILKSKF